MPIQRVPRYRMLLSELLKRTPDDHPDHAQLESALTEVVRLADDINESVRAAESDEHVRQLQRKLIGLDFPLLAPGRVFVRDGTLDKVRAAYRQIRARLSHSSVTGVQKRRQGALFRALQRHSAVRGRRRERPAPLESVSAGRRSVCEREHGGSRARLSNHDAAKVVCGHCQRPARARQLDAHADCGGGARAAQGGRGGRPQRIGARGRRCGGHC